MNFILALNMFKNSFFIVLLTLFCLQTNGQIKVFKEQLDSIQKLRQLSSNKNLDRATRIEIAEQASALSYKTEVDTIILNSNNNLRSSYKPSSDSYRSLAHKNLILSKKIKDSISMAQNWYALGRYYSSFNVGNRVDSAYFYYYKSKNLYEKKQDKYHLAKVLFFLAVLQKNEKIYIRSEITSIKALSILNELSQTNNVIEYKSYIYNNLGIVFNQLKQYEESIKYYSLSLQFKRKLKGDFQSAINNTLNNLGRVYERFGKYDKAIENYNKLLKNKKFRNERPDFYTTVLDNYAYALFLSNEHKSLPKLYLEALHVCDSIKDSYRSITIHQHLAEYYNTYNKKDSALYHGYKAKEISERFYKDDLLESLLILSRIETDSIAVKHYEAYIALNDSIQFEERLTRNKHARIEFETDKYIEETERLSVQNVLIVVIASILILVLVLLYFIKLQQSKNKKLQYKAEQEKASQEIYKLILEQQTKQEEGRLQERYRISEDLHDGVLSRLFGARMGMGFLELKGAPDTLKQYKGFVEELQKTEKEIRDISHELKSDALILKTNFESLIETYIKAQSAIGHFKYKIINEDHINFESFSEIIRVEIYRILQEAIQNILKHAKAKVISVSFVLKQNTLKISILDDGVGFDAEKKHKGIGLKNIRARVLKLEGDLKITTLPDNNTGTQLEISIPVKKVN